MKMFINFFFAYPKSFQTDQRTIETDQRKIAARKYKTKAM